MALPKLLSRLQQGACRGSSVAAVVKSVVVNEKPDIKLAKGVASQTTWSWLLAIAGIVLEL